MKIKEKKIIPPGAGAKAGGYAHNICEKVFPTISSGQQGPFSLTPDRPARPPEDSADSDDVRSDWVEHFVEYICSRIEYLNALQFRFHETPGNELRMSNTLNELAEKLEIGTATNPAKLVWPLSGPYSVDIPKETTGYDAFRIDMFFFVEPEYMTVTNCIIEILTRRGGGIEESTDSSYMATSSSM